MFLCVRVCVCGSMRVWLRKIPFGVGMSDSDGEVGDVWCFSLSLSLCVCVCVCVFVCVWFGERCGRNCSAASVLHAPLCLCTYPTDSYGELTSTSVPHHLFGVIYKLRRPLTPPCPIGTPGYSPDLAAIARHSKTIHPAMKLKQHQTKLSFAYHFGDEANHWFSVDPRALTFNCMRNNQSSPACECPRGKLFSAKTAVQIVFIPESSGNLLRSQAVCLSLFLPQSPQSTLA